MIAPHLQVVPPAPDALPAAAKRELAEVQAETARYIALLHHFAAARCCGLCSVYFALVTVERELGREVVVPPPGCQRRRLVQVGPAAHVRLSCEEAARRAWASRPRRTP